MQMSCWKPGSSGKENFSGDKIKETSRARLSGMNPASRAKHKKLAQYDRTNNIRKLARYEEHEVT